MGFPCHLSPFHSQSDLILISPDACSQVASTFLGSKKAPAPPPPEHAIPGSSGPVVSPNIRPAWPLGSVFDMYVVLSTSLRDPFGVETPQMYDLPWVKWENIKLGDWKEDRVENMEVNLPLVSTL